MIEFIINKHSSGNHVIEYFMEKNGIAFCMLNYYENEKHIMYLSNLNIEEEHRQNGYGDDVLYFIKTYAKVHGCEYLYLSSENNKSWITEWYKRKGFKVFNEVENGECNMFLKL